MLYKSGVNGPLIDGGNLDNYVHLWCEKGTSTAGTMLFDTVAVRDAYGKKLLLEVDAENKFQAIKQEIIFS